MSVSEAKSRSTPQSPSTKSERCMIDLLDESPPRTKSPATQNASVPATPIQAVSGEKSNAKVNPSGKVKSSVGRGRSREDRGFVL